MRPRSATDADLADGHGLVVLVDDPARVALAGLLDGRVALGADLVGRAAERVVRDDVDDDLGERSHVCGIGAAS